MHYYQNFIILSLHIHVVSATEQNARQLRDLACQYIHDNRDEEWAEDWVGPDWSLTDTMEEAQGPNDKARWGRTIHTIALAKLLNAEILVFEPNGMPKFQLYTPTMNSAPSIKNKQDSRLPLIPLLLTGDHYSVFEDVRST